jgi:hypothetical protein
MSTSLFCQVSGSIAETVIKPSGGTAAFLEMNRKAYLKLQNEAGYWGEINNTFIDFYISIYKNCFVKNCGIQPKRLLFFSRYQQYYAADSHYGNPDKRRPTEMMGFVSSDFKTTDINYLFPGKKGNCSKNG